MSKAMGLEDRFRALRELRVTRSVTCSLTCVTLAASLGLTAVGCGSVQKAARNTTYSAYELVGVEKRDLLKRRVDDARDEQKEAGEEFTSALDRLKALTGYDGGDLEKEYRSLASAYEAANEEASDVKKSIEGVETVASDLFEEWEKEIGQIETANLRSSSRATLADTRRRYDELHGTLKRSEKRMGPVLTKMNDQVLYLKHNLNARAMSSLKGEAVRIQADIEKLVKDMNDSIAAADRFIAEMK